MSLSGNNLTLVVSNNIGLLNLGSNQLLSFSIKLSLALLLSLGKTIGQLLLLRLLLRLSVAEQSVSL